MSRTSHIYLERDSLKFAFSSHESALRGRATEWFDEKLSAATPAERRNLAEYVLVDGERLGAGLGDCQFSMSFQRTLRVPDDGREYPLPAGLGRLPVRNVRALKSPAIPQDWRGSPVGLVALHAAEAMWLHFSGYSGFAVQIAAGDICAVSGVQQAKNLIREPQNYVVTPEQSWLDGFRIGPDAVRQFVAMPLGKGFTVEGQVNGTEQIGGVQLRVVPPTVDFLWEHSVRETCEWRWRRAVEPRQEEEYRSSIVACSGGVSESLGLGAGGRIRQKIYADPHPPGTWDEAAALSCELKLIDARRWRDFTGESIPTKPPTPQQYADAGIPWFDYENGAAAIAGEAPIAGVSSVASLYGEKTGLSFPDNDMIEVGETVKLGHHSSPSDGGSL